MTRSSTARLLRTALCAAAAILSAAGALAQAPEAPAPHSSARSRPIPGQYIVVFRQDVADPRAEADEAVRSVGGRRHHTYTTALKGFSATLTEEAVERLRGRRSVEYIEQDQTMSIAGSESPATWGLDRIDQADRPLDTIYNYAYTGAGVYAFIIDTGLRANHTEFTGRTLPGHNTAPHSGTFIDPNDTSDCAGHGTHVAGTVGGTTWGVAKGVTLVPVRVLACDGTGTTSGVIAGIDWVANSALRPAVANMSLGGGKSSALNSAVAKAVAKGVTMVVAAGNDSTTTTLANACNYSPAGEPSAITVGATTNADARAYFSNAGSCVDIFAPGLGITSSWNTGPSDTKTISGTSMATPHVTGVAALALEANPSASPLAVTSFLVGNATPNRLTSIGTGSPNLLLFSLAAGVPVEPPQPVIAVGALSGRHARATRGWRAQATITMRNLATGANVPNVTVTGAFAPGGSGSCVTSSRNGSCTITSTILSTSMPSTVFTVDNAAANGMTYDGSQNSATQITINRR